ncbi:hypothetical protein P389DRAFT_181622 [Cystobasidium minutum MCA 4210]|uniref:uncharacterized protein n=1 Tax=Cystobasidium minutum MCA 4210 TaxID=1397322 RepID=UPI0034CD704A|eukprot:jgi/Rhomi1/181622/fgenesh1_pg.7_\
MPSPASCVEVALLRLKKPSSTAELEQNATHRTALDIVTSQPNNLGCTWAVLSEDPTLLVWLVDWVEMKDHTEGFMKSSIYPHFNDLFTTLLDPKPIVYMTHFTFPTPPSELASARHPTLQILQTSLSPDTNAHEALEAFKPVEEIWKSSDRNVEGRTRGKNGQTRPGVPQ